MRGGSAKPGVRLNYPEIRDQIRDGDIVLFRGTSWFSRLLRWGMRSPYSHSGVLAWWNGRLMLLEAVPQGVLASRMSWVVNHYSGSCELWTARDEHDGRLARDEVIRAAQLLIGRRYSKFKLIRNARRILFGRGKVEERDPEADPDDFVCSEFVSRVWRAGGVDLYEDTPDVYTKPSDIARSPTLHKVGDLWKSKPGTFENDTVKRPASLEEKTRG
jgi:hypothetical protein